MGGQQPCGGAVAQQRLLPELHQRAALARCAVPVLLQGQEQEDVAQPKGWPVWLPTTARSRPRQCAGRLLRGTCAGLLMWTCALPLDGPRPARSAVPASAEANRIDIAYLPPKDPKHRALYELLTSRRVLEKIQAI